MSVLDRVHSFAAMNAAVPLAPRTPGVTAFVNAVLRSFARRGVREREPAPPRDPLEALATRRSFPTWTADRGAWRFGRPPAEPWLAPRTRPRPPPLRPNRSPPSRDPPP